MGFINCGNSASSKPEFDVGWIIVERFEEEEEESSSCEKEVVRLCPEKSQAFRVNDCFLLSEGIASRRQE